MKTMRCPNCEAFLTIGESAAADVVCPCGTKVSTSSTGDGGPPMHDVADGASDAFTARSPASRILTDDTLSRPDRSAFRRRIDDDFDIARPAVFKRLAVSYWSRLAAAALFAFLGVGMIVHSYDVTHRVREADGDNAEVAKGATPILTLLIPAIPGLILDGADDEDDAPEAIAPVPPIRINMP